MDVQNPLIINLAPTGMIPTREMSPYVPIQPDEVIADVLACASVGITLVHIHARETDGRPTYKKEIYARIVSGIREKRPDLIICVSCSGRDFGELEKRADVLNLTGDLCPDMASLTLSSLNFPKQASVNEPSMVYALAQRMLDRGIRPEFEVFDLGMANYARVLVQKLELEQPIYANVILGNIATAQADLLSIATLITMLPEKAIWTLGGIGFTQAQVTAIGAIMAPGVRIGLEDNLWADAQRTNLATNRSMVERIQGLAQTMERPIMTASELRRVLGLRSWQ